MSSLSALTSVLTTTILLASAAPQAPSYMNTQSYYGYMGGYPSSTPGYWQAQGAEPSSQGPQSYYGSIGSYPSSTPDYWQAQGAEPSTQGPLEGMRDNSMVTFTTEKPRTNPLGFITPLEDAQKIFTGSVDSLPYPNFLGFPLYPFTPYAQGLWWR